MGVQIRWDNGTDEKNLIIMTCERPWTWIDFDRAAVRLAEMFNNVSQSTDMIIDIRKAGFPPTGAMQRFKKAAEHQPPHLGTIAFVGHAAFVINSIELLTRSYPGEFKAPQHCFAANVEQARDTLAMQRARIHA